MSQASTVQASQAVVEQFSARYSTTLLNPTDTEVWNEWLALKRRDCGDYRDLLSSDVRDNFKARALLLLLLPKLDWSPIAYNSDNTDTYAMYIDLGKIPATLIAFAKDAVLTFLPLAQQIARTDKNKYPVAEAYNKHLHKLLALLPEEEATHVFACFDINDQTSYQDNYNEYRPLGALLRDPRIPARWKREADAKLRVIVIEEIAGTRPEGNRSALRCYIDFIEWAASINPDEQETVWGKQLLKDQLAFVMSFILALQPIRLFDSWRMTQLLALLTNPKDRYAFAKFMLVRNGQPFQVYGSDDLAIARLLQTEVQAFGDTNLVERAKTIIAEGEQHIARRTQEKQAAAAAQAAVLAKMK